MRKRIRVLVLAAVVAAVVVPVGFALSLDRRAARLHPSVSTAHVTAAPSPIFATTSTAFTTLVDVPDSAKLFAVGAMLCGIAAAMRRAF
jgi:hypothetical protein